MCIRWGLCRLWVFGKWVLELDSAVLVVEGTVDSLVGDLTVKFPHMVHFPSPDWV